MPVDLIQDLLAEPRVFDRTRPVQVREFGDVGTRRKEARLSCDDNALGFRLAQCRSPLGFLTAHWRPGAAGSFVLGMRHGAYCVGCCWVLMALLFVGGIMNLVWIAALSLIVFVEKILPRGQQVGRVLGVVLIAWAGATLLV